MQLLSCVRPQGERHVNCGGGDTALNATKFRNGFETRRDPSCEGSLVDSAKAGNADAFAQLIAPHYRICLLRAYSMLAKLFRRRR